MNFRADWAGLDVVKYLTVYKTILASLLAMSLSYRLLNRLCSTKIVQSEFWYTATLRALSLCSFKHPLRLGRYVTSIVLLSGPAMHLSHSSVRV